MKESDNSDRNPEVSVVLPALNEEETIAVCIEKIHRVFREQSISGEIIIADSSTDRTPEIASNLQGIVIHPEKLGYGNAYREAFSKVKGASVIIGDADNTYDFLEIPAFLAMLDNGCDLVMGSRFRGEIKKGAMPPLHQYIGNPFLTWVLNAVFRTHVSDVHCGFRAIRTEALRKMNLKTTGMEFASEMVIEAARMGLKIGEVPITYYPREAPSKLSSFTDGWRHLRFILLYRPIPFLAIPGLIFVCLGLLFMLGFYFKGNVEGSHLHSFILSAMALTGGLQAFVMGITIKIYSIKNGFSERSGFVARFMEYHNLERELLAGGFLMLVGALIGLTILFRWFSAGFGDLFEISSAVWALVFLLCGMQILFASILASMMILQNGGRGG